MAEVTGFAAVMNVLRRLHAKASKTASATALVGYTQNYAVYVHENLLVHHPVGKAKYLEEPARVNMDVLAKIVEQVYTRTGNMAQAVLTAGLRLQRESQKEVPVDTGALKNSAFTALDDK